MSGGALDYFYSSLEEHVGDFKDKELDDLVKDLARLFYDREWYLSGDTSIGQWREAKKAFKNKWFTREGCTERTEKYLKEISDEVREMFDIEYKMCGDCSHWTKGTDAESPYGHCEFEQYCLMHRGEVCEKFERR